MPSNLPPGTTHKMIENQFEDGPCSVCYRSCEDCVCPECPTCGVQGDPACYGSEPSSHINVFTKEQIVGQIRRRIDSFQDLAMGEAQYLSHIESKPEGYTQPAAAFTPEQNCHNADGVSKT